MQRLTTKFAAVKLLVGKEHAGELRKIDKMRHKKSQKPKLVQAIATADEIAEELGEISIAQSPTSPGEPGKSLQHSRWNEAEGSVQDMSNESSSAARDQVAEDHSVASGANAPRGVGRHGKKRRIRTPRAVKRARAVAMAAENERAGVQMVISTLDAATESEVE